MKIKLRQIKIEPSFNAVDKTGIWNKNIKIYSRLGFKFYIKTLHNLCL